MIKIVDARWATKNETERFYSYLKKRTNNKDLFTSNWLSKSGNDFIELHNNFIEDKTNDQIKNYKLKHRQRVLEYKNKLKEYESLSGKQCNCKGNLIEIVAESYQFVGCDNFRERGWDHFRMYKPQEPRESDFYNDYIYEPSSAYLVEMRKFYNLPKDLKPSVLLEYLTMKGITPLTDTSATLGTAKLNKGFSDKRESIVKPILKSKLDKLKSQPLMIITYSDGNVIKRIPDFVGSKNNTVYIIEQKKDVSLIKEVQTNVYCEAISFMIDKSGKDMSIEVRYIIEDGSTDEENNIINFKDLEYYEFN